MLTCLFKMVNIAPALCHHLYWDFTMQLKAPMCPTAAFRMIKYFWLLWREAQCSWLDYMGSDRVSQRMWAQFCYVWPRSQVWAYTEKVSQKYFFMWHLHLVCCIICCHLWVITCVKTHEKQHALFPKSSCDCNGSVIMTFTAAAGRPICVDVQ